MLTRRTLSRFAALVVALGAPLVIPGAAEAQSTPCWRAVVNDWWDNSRVDKVYPIRCYREALAKLPEDMQAYSSAPDDIERAMRSALRSQQGNPTLGSPDRGAGQVEAGPDERTNGGGTRSGRAGGGRAGGDGTEAGDGGDRGDARSDGDDTGTGGGTGGGTGAAGGAGGGTGGARDTGADGPAGTGGGTGAAGGAGDESADTEESKPEQGVFHEALDKIGPDDASSFPLPLLILAAIALALLALGTIGFAARRFRSRP